MMIAPSPVTVGEEHRDDRAHQQREHQRPVAAELRRVGHQRLGDPGRQHDPAEQRAEEQRRVDRRELDRAERHDRTRSCTPASAAVASAISGTASSAGSLRAIISAGQHAGRPRRSRCRSARRWHHLVPRRHDVRAQVVLAHRRRRSGRRSAAHRPRRRGSAAARARGRARCSRSATPPRTAARCSRARRAAPSTGTSRRRDCDRPARRSVSSHGRARRRSRRAPPCRSAAGVPSWS